MESREELQNRIDELEERVFYKQMKDHWTQDDYKAVRELENHILELKEQLKKLEDENGEG